MAAASWPSSVPAPVEQEVDAIDEVANDQSPYTGSREVSHRYHQWHVLCHWNAMNISARLALKSHLAKSRGGITLYQVPILEGRKKRGTKTGSPNLSGTIAAGTRSITITGGGGLFDTGDWIWISRATNVPYAYIVTAAEVAGVLTIDPGLRGPGSYTNSNVHYIGESSEILDTMELATTSPSLGRTSVQPVPRYGLPFSVEFVTALRRNP